MIITEPGAIPATFPERSIVATAASAQLQFPPDVVLPSDIELPEQTVFEPDIKAGSGLTVIAFVAKQPAGSVYVIMTAPALIPVTIPPLIETTEISELDHEPPLVLSVNDRVLPAQTILAPVIAAGVGLTVISSETEHPVGKI